ncbi:TlpA family protein disulfide reductase [Sphingobacterium yanglingense]|uniref:Thiol-disulfide isomerase/thioredoxin n=1 Tax=Sphingobacterium yanglingense TaxID=1437280 RepID=A0A4R6WLT7_9SPHI|nr:TlpA disulfide reductase family protein [Sphingobacterium yanglingense]TDQ79295.1 thiol-disulfide isomerase/thioredoxin [Sphingobacterium yanglingense]
MKNLFHHIFIIILGVSFAFTSFSQTVSETRAISIGDPVPDILISGLKNYPNDQVRISDFKGKLLILDFWATWCPSCYESFPQFDRLQKQFDDEIQIILVNAIETKDTEKKISNLFEKQLENLNYQVKLPYVNLEPTLGKLFPFQSLPQYVWIDGEGKLRAITQKSDVTPENIRHVLQGGFFSHTKKDIPDFDRQKPLTIDLFNREDIGQKYRSLLTGYIEGITQGYNSFSPSGVVRDKRVYRYNTTLKMLMTMGNIFHELKVSTPGVQMAMPIPNSQVIFETSNARLQSSFLNVDDFDRDRMYTYELILPDTLRFNVVKEFMREDISRYFNFKLKKEDRKTSVFVLNSTPKLANIESTFDVVNQGQATEYYKTYVGKSTNREAEEKYIKNGTIDNLLNWLNSFSAVPILTNEVITHQSQRYDFDFPRDIYEYTPEQLKAYLEGIGFGVFEEERVMPFVVFSNRY